MGGCQPFAKQDADSCGGGPGGSDSGNSNKEEESGVKVV